MQVLKCFGLLSLRVGAAFEVTVDDSGWFRTASTSTSALSFSKMAVEFVWTGTTMLDTLLVSAGGVEVTASGGCAQTGT